MITWYQVTASAEPTEAETAARDRIKAAWQGAPMLNLELLGMVLETAQEQVTAYAPALAEGVALPTRYAYAQLQQAQNLWNAGTVTSDGDMGGEGFSFTPRPLDKTIKSIIRPIDGKPHVL